MRKKAPLTCLHALGVRQSLHSASARRVVAHPLLVSSSPRRARGARECTESLTLKRRSAVVSRLVNASKLLSELSGVLFHVLDNLRNSFSRGTSRAFARASTDDRPNAAPPSNHDPRCSDPDLPSLPCAILAWRRRCARSLSLAIGEGDGRPRTIAIYEVALTSSRFYEADRLGRNSTFGEDGARSERSCAATADAVPSGRSSPWDNDGDRRVRSGVFLKSPPSCSRTEKMATRRGLVRRRRRGARAPARLTRWRSDARSATRGFRLTHFMGASDYAPRI